MSEPEREPDFRWNGRPVYQCRICGAHYQRIENLASVLQHEREAHGPELRLSPILGTDGEPLLVGDKGKE